MDFEAVLEKCGGFGRYQFMLMLFFGCTNIFSSMHYFTQTIISFTPEHWCYHEELENITMEELRDFYATAEDQSCTSFEAINSENLTKQENSAMCRRWIYDYESGYQSVSTELNWVCDNAYKSAVGQSLFFIGSVCGTIFFGFLADKIGRLPALILSSITGGLGDFITSFIQTLPAFAACRFIAGLSTDTMFYMMYVLVFEYLSPSRRTLGLNLVQLVFFTLGMFMAPWLAIWVGTWRHFLLVASLPILCTLLYPLLLCESALWLITKKKLKGATKALQHVAKINGRQVEEEVFVKFEAYYELKIADDEKLNLANETFLGLFRTPNLRKFIIILLIKSIIITMSFDIMGRNMEGLGTSPFKLFAFSALTAMPAGLTIIWLQRYIGRKGMACGSLLVGGIITAITATMIAILDRERNGTLFAILATLGRYGSIVAYDAEAQYAAEIIPTSVRGQGVANVHVVGFAFNFLSAYIIFLGHTFKPLPTIVISVLMLTGALLCLALPETMNRKLPETLADGEKFGKDEKWTYFFCFPRKKSDVEITKL